MKNIKDVMREGRQKLKRVELVGGAGVNTQNRRREKAKTPKAVTLDVQKRIGEYKRGRVISNLKRHKNPDNK